MTRQGARLQGAGLLQGARAGLLTRIGTLYPWGHFPLAAPLGRHLFPGKLSRTERGMWQSRQQKQNKVVKTSFPFRVQCKVSSWSLTKSKPPTCTSSAVWVPGQEHPAAAWFEEPFQAERGKHGGGDQGAPRFRKVLK